MVWDDHDMSDDWNISRSWHEEMDAKPGGTSAPSTAIMSYWIYQHLGNLSPRELDENELYAQVRGNPDATAVLREWAKEIDSTAAGARWSFCRDIDGVRAIFMDSRAARVLTRERRSMFDDEDWEWIVEHASGDFDHLLIATTVPYLLSPGFHHLEAWNERLCDGAWGGLVARGEREAAPRGRLRPLGRLPVLLPAAARAARRGRRRGQRGQAPASIVVLSGDVHHAYLREIAFRPGVRGARAPVVPGGLLALPQPARRERAAGGAGRLLAAPSPPSPAASPGSPARPTRGSAGALLEGPYFDNQVATLRLDGRHASVRLDKTVAGEEDEQALEKTFERRLDLSLSPRQRWGRGRESPRIRRAR